VRVFRKVVLPLVWVAIFLTIAVSLSVMAFESPPKPAGSGVKPTGEIPVSNTIVERSTVENTLEMQGQIVVDPPASAKASHEGVINHFFVPVGAKVKKGDNLFQVKVDEAGEGSEEGDAPKPKVRYFNTVAPKSGKVASFAKEIDDTVAKGDVVASIRQSSFKASGTISPLDQYRLLKMPESATVTIEGGPAPFKCHDLSIGGSTAPEAPSDEFNDPAEEPEFQGPESGGGGGGEAITCRVPRDVRVFNGLTMTMVVDAGTAEDVLVVPVTAVRGLVDRGTVWVTGDEGEPVERRVRLGISDGNVVEVTKGLKEGENVLEFVPGADSGRGGGGDGGRGVVVEGYAE
jgi:multidrug efflux pump subunit AcrA (membrane-fusion protein)